MQRWNSSSSGCPKSCTLSWFRATSRAQVDAFHEAGLAAGGVDNGRPGLRTGGYPPGYYAAFLLDPDGNNVEALFRER